MSAPNHHGMQGVQAPTLMQKALRGTNQSGRLPVWMMRQAGRYHSHYQDLRRRYSFRDLCLVPELALETTMGPIRDYGFDAAILFSDILFALEACGNPVTYNDRGPEMAFKLHSGAEMHRLHQADPVYFDFQREACRLLKKELPATTSLIGFCGSPWTLFVFLCEGTYKGHLSRARALYLDGTFQRVAPYLTDAVFWSLKAQIEGGADMLQIFDSAAGVLTPGEYAGAAYEWNATLVNRVKNLNAEIIFFAKGASEQTECLRLLDCDAHSIDSVWPLESALRWFPNEKSVQGNLDSEILLAEAETVRRKTVELFRPLIKCPRLIANLGHGILPGTPPENVRLVVETLRELSEGRSS